MSLKTGNLELEIRPSADPEHFLASPSGEDISAHPTSAQIAAFRRLGRLQLRFRASG